MVIWRYYTGAIMGFAYHWVTYFMGYHCSHTVVWRSGYYSICYSQEWRDIWWFKVATLRTVATATFSRFALLHLRSR